MQYLLHWWALWRAMCDAWLQALLPCKVPTLALEASMELSPRFILLHEVPLLQSWHQRQQFIARFNSPWDQQTHGIKRESKINGHWRRKSIEIGQAWESYDTGWLFLWKIRGVCDARLRLLFVQLVLLAMVRRPHWLRWRNANGRVKLQEGHDLHWVSRQELWARLRVLQSPWY